MGRKRTYLVFRGRPKDKYEQEIPLLSLERSYVTYVMYL